jgi:hypothetical protein
VRGDTPVGVILAGVVLTIAPLLSLAANQTNKVGMQASQEFGNDVSFHLGEIKDRTRWSDAFESNCAISYHFLKEYEEVLSVFLNACRCIYESPSPMSASQCFL